MKKLEFPLAIYCTKCNEQLFGCMCCSPNVLGTHTAPFRFDHTCIDGGPHDSGDFVFTPMRLSWIDDEESV